MKNSRIPAAAADDADDAAAAHPLAAAGLGAGSPELLRHRSQHCCARGGELGGAWAWRGSWICGAADRILFSWPFSAVLCRSAASPVEDDRRLLPPPIDPACLAVPCWANGSRGVRARVLGCAVWLVGVRVGMCVALLTGWTRASTRSGQDDGGDEGEGSEREGP
jgi:hypothetical protein